jgi:anti-anti-sigma factor
VAGSGNDERRAVTSLRVESEPSAEALHVRLEGELDLVGVGRLEQELAGRENANATLIIDLRDVDFIDSSGLRAVLLADRRAREQGRRCVVVRGPEAVDRVFRITGCDQRLEIVDDPAQI